MKKILLSLTAVALLSLPTLVKAQMHDADFETWTHTAGPPAYDDPNSGITTPGWQDLNITSSSFLGASPVSVYKDSVKVHSGKYSARIETVKLSATTIGFVGAYIPHDTLGIIMTGYFSGTVLKVGIPDTMKMENNFTFWFLGDPMAGDTNTCTVRLSKWTGTSREIIAEGIWENTTVDTATWQQATVTMFQLIHGVQPDTAVILFSSSTVAKSGKPVPGSKLWVDDAAPTAVEDFTHSGAHVTVYPNPANNSVNLAVTSQIQATHVEVYDVTGKLIDTYSMHYNFLTINTQTYNSGLYIYKMFDNTGAQLNVGKFSVSK